MPLSAHVQTCPYRCVNYANLQVLPYVQGGVPKSMKTVAFALFNARQRVMLVL